MWGRFLYKYAGSMFDDLAIQCFKLKYPDSQQKVKLLNTIDSSPKTVEIDCLVGNKAYEIKWKDATTDGDHIKKEHKRVRIIKDAVVLTNDRLGSLIKTESHLLKKGKAAYRNLSEKQMNILQCLNAIPVQRNSGIDGFLKDYIYDRPVSVKIQREDETLDEAVSKLSRSSTTKQCSFMILVRTHIDYLHIFDFDTVPSNMRIIDSYEVEMDILMESFKNRSENRKIVVI